MILYLMFFTSQVTTNHVVLTNESPWVCFAALRSVLKSCLASLKRSIWTLTPDCASTYKVVGSWAVPVALACVLHHIGFHGNVTHQLKTLGRFGHKHDECKSKKKKESLFCLICFVIFKKRSIRNQWWHTRPAGWTAPLSRTLPSTCLPVCRFSHYSLFALASHSPRKSPVVRDLSSFSTETYWLLWWSRSALKKIPSFYLNAVFSLKGHCTDQCTNLSYLSSVVEGLPPPPHTTTTTPSVPRLQDVWWKSIIWWQELGALSFPYILLTSVETNQMAGTQRSTMSHTLKWADQLPQRCNHFTLMLRIYLSATILFLQTGSSADSGFSRACFALSCSCAVSQAMFFFCTE